MKPVLLASFLMAALLSTVSLSAQQDKSKRPSPPDSVTATTKSGATVTINYSQPSVKGRTIGKEIAPFGQVWRTGANEATTFEVSKDVMIEGKPLKAGKYSLYSIPGQDQWTIIFNKTWNQWGTVYKMEEDVLRVNVKPTRAPSFTEKMKFSTTGDVVTLMWGDTQVSFNVQ